MGGGNVPRLEFCLHKTKITIFMYTKFVLPFLICRDILEKGKQIRAACDI